MAERDVIQRLADRVAYEEQGPPNPNAVRYEEQGPPNPAQERREQESLFARAVDRGEVDLNDPSVRARLDPEAREVVIRRAENNRNEAVQKQVKEELQRWWSPGVVDRLAQRVRPEGEAPERASVDETRQRFDAAIGLLKIEDGRPLSTQEFAALQALGVVQRRGSNG